MRRACNGLAALFLACLGGVCSPPAAARQTSLAIVVQDNAPLRAAARDGSQQLAALWQGEIVEVRAERLDFLQVWDHGRERGGFLRASQLRRVSLAPEDAPELLSVVRFLRETPGAEALGIGFAAAFLKAAPAAAIDVESGSEALDAIGSFAARLAHRASSGAAQGKAAAHLEVAARYGLRFASYEREGRMQVCYDGEAFRRVLAMPSKPNERARAALGLTIPECVDPQLPLLQRMRYDEWRTEVLDRVDASALAGYLRNRVHMRRAAVWGSLAFQRMRTQSMHAAGAIAAMRALTEFGGINRAELADDDLNAYNDAVMHANASRWAAMPASSEFAGAGGRLVLRADAGQPGETCVTLAAVGATAKGAAQAPLAKRCTYGVAWLNSASVNREANAAVLAVQTMDAWRELWVFRQTANGWSVSVLPPATINPGLGYAEFAGWIPGGRQVLVAREARGEGKYRRGFEVISLDSLATERRTDDPSNFGPFQRWQDRAWKQATLSLR